MRPSKTSTKPWYREPWPWLLMAGPALVVVAGITTLWLAVTSDDGLVADDYYKRGLAINQVLAREDEARARNYSAHVAFAADGGLARVTLFGERLPSVIRMQLVHPTRAGMDRAATLPAVRTGVYEGPIALPDSGRWRVVLEDAGSNWRLAGDWHAREEASVQIRAPERRNR